MSVSVALGMAYAGAEGETGKEMENVLFSGLSDSAVHDSFANIVPILNPDTDAFALHCANRLYAHKDMEFKKDFMDICSVKYQSSLAQVNFKTEAEKVRGEINDWVEKTTKERIKDLIAPGVLTELTRLVLVNAIYFKGTWLSVFNPKRTAKESFHPKLGEEVKVDMMHQTDDFRYAENGGVQVLRLPYNGSDDLDMFIFLPKQRCGLNEWLSQMTAVELTKLMDSCRSEEVIVSLPKWKMETSMELSEELKKLGMPLPFHEQKAELGGIADLAPGELNLYISNVIHKAFLEVSEEGTEAAAATGVVMAVAMCAVIKPPPKQFRADHPFLFILRSGPHWLFAGVMEQ